MTDRNRPSFCDAPLPPPPLTSCSPYANIFEREQGNESRTEYEALLNHKSELENRLAALDAEVGSRAPHEVAVAVIRGNSPILAFRIPRSHTEAVAHLTKIPA